MAMACGDLLACSAVLPFRSRSGRPRPVSCLGIVASLSCWGWGCLCPFFSQPDDGGAGGGGGGRGGGGKGSDDDGEDAEAPLVPTKGGNNQVEAKQICSNDSRSDDAEQLKLHLTKMLHFFSSFNSHLMTIVSFSASLEHRVTAILNILAQMEICMATNRDSSTVPTVTDTAAKKDALNRMKGLLGSMYSIVDKLLMFCGTVFLWLLSNNPASKAGQNFKDLWMQVLITGNLILCFISFILMALASKLKDSESIEGVLCKIFIWLLLPVFLALWPGLCMILHFFAHTPVFVLWPLGALLSILCFWYWAFYKEQQKILKELKKGGLLEKGLLPDKPESESALPKV